MTLSNKEKYTYHPHIFKCKIDSHAKIGIGETLLWHQLSKMGTILKIALWEDYCLKDNRQWSALAHLGSLGQPWPALVSLGLHWSALPSLDQHCPALIALASIGQPW